MDVVVSGASGLIGSALVPALAAAGHRPIRLVRGAATSADAVAWDPARGEIDAKALEGVDAVVNLNGANLAACRWTPEYKREIVESRTVSTSLLAATVAGLERKPSVFVSGSGIGYYGGRGHDELTEASARGEDFVAWLTEEWEAAAAPAAAAGIRVVLMRTGFVLASHGGGLRRMLPQFRLGLGGRLGPARRYVSWISLDDEIAAVLDVIGDPSIEGPVNFTAPNPVTNGEFTRTLGKVLRRPAILPMPLAPVRRAYGKEFVEHLLLDGQRVLPARLQAAGFAFTHPTLEPALRAALARRAG
jgi:uncharacterized protein (TIGR01777 family)